MTDIITREPILIIGDIIKRELELSSGAVMLYYEKFDIVTDPGLYVTLSYVSGKAIGNNNYFDSINLTEVQEVAMNHIIQIDLMSFDASARTRKEEVIMALRSMASQNAQDQYGIQIARIPSEFVNASSLEATKILNRFTMSIVVKSLYRKTKAAAFYDTFTGPDVHVAI